MSIPRFLKLLLASTLLASLPATQGFASAPEDIFVPGNRVPLSAYVYRSTSQIQLFVDNDILKNLSNSSIRVAQLANGWVSFLIPQTVDPNFDPMNEVGLVELNTPVFFEGPCVVVSNNLRQTTNIVTHWLNPDESSGYPRGKQSEGAKQGIKRLAFFNHAMKGWGIHQTTAQPWTPPAPGAFYNTEAWALFSDGSGVNDHEKYPAFERYDAETFSYFKPTAKAAVALSDMVRERTGWPVRHRNPGPGQPLMDEAPCFQIVHCLIVNIDEGLEPGDERFPAIAGYEHSLGTVILPPGWDADFASMGIDYPILFEGFYDIHRSTFQGTGLEHMEAIAEVMKAPNEDSRVIGVLWNGGGATATTTLHESAYHNAAKLINDIADGYGGDRDRVVVTGGSRSGTTALAIASKPYAPFSNPSTGGDYDYTVEYVIAGAPQVRIGEAVNDFANASYFLAHFSMIQASGYLDAWMSNFTPDPVNLVLQNLVGPPPVGMTIVDHANSVSPNSSMLIDDVRTNGLFIDGLIANGSLKGEVMGVRIVLKVGTHDYSHSYAQIVEYVDALRTADVRVQFQIFYGAGHKEVCLDDDDEITNAEVLEMLFTSSTLMDENQHFRTAMAEDLDYDRFCPVHPGHIPVTFEIPLIVGSGDVHTWSVVGEPGADVIVTWRGPDDPQTIIERFEELADTGGEFGVYTWSQSAPELPELQGDWTYEVSYDHDGEGGDDPVILSCAATVHLHPFDDAKMTVEDEETLGANPGNSERTGGVASPMTSSQ